MRATTFIAVLIALLSSTVLAAPLAAEAQQPAKVFRLGLLGTVPLTEPGASRIWDGFLEGLWQLGYVEGRNIVIERGFSEGRYERVPALAAELVRLKVDVIVAASYTADAAKGATSTIPIVMTNHGDPGGGWARGQPRGAGGNVTGLSGQSPDLVGKQLQLL